MHNPKGFLKKARRKRLRRRDRSRQKYAAAISSSHNYIWFPIAKNANRSIADILDTWTTLDSGSFDPSKRIMIDIRKKSFHEKFKFVVCRNPYERVVSAWFSECIRRPFGNPPNPKLEGLEQYKRFPQFINKLKKKDLTTFNKHFKLQTRLYPSNPLVNVFRIRYEHLQEDFKLVCNMLYIPEEELPHLRRTLEKSASDLPERHDYKWYYNENAKIIVSKLYKEDIEHFGYSYD